MCPRTFSKIYCFCLLHRSIKGIIVTLDETGYIYCSYLGTDPSLFVAPSSESRDLQYDVSLQHFTTTRQLSLSLSLNWLIATSLGRLLFVCHF